VIDTKAAGGSRCLLCVCACCVCVPAVCVCVPAVCVLCVLYLCCVRAVCAGDSEDSRARVSLLCPGVLPRSMRRRRAWATGHALRKPRDPASSPCPRAPPEAPVPPVYAALCVCAVCVCAVCAVPSLLSMRPSSRVCVRAACTSHMHDTPHRSHARPPTHPLPHRQSRRCRAPGCARRAVYGRLPPPDVSSPAAAAASGGSVAAPLPADALAAGVAGPRAGSSAALPRLEACRVHKARPLHVPCTPLHAPARPCTPLHAPAHPAPEPRRYTSHQTYNTPEPLYASTRQSRYMPQHTVSECKSVRVRVRACVRACACLCARVLYHFLIVTRSS
jgi:hypothetical protein